MSVDVSFFNDNACGKFDAGERDGNPFADGNIVGGSAGNGDGLAWRDFDLAEEEVVVIADGLFVPDESDDDTFEFFGEVDVFFNLEADDGECIDHLLIGAGGLKVLSEPFGIDKHGGDPSRFVLLLWWGMLCN